MKIIMLLTNRFDPDVRVYKEAKHLVENGHQVEILCWDRENEYRDKAIEELDGIIVKRFFPYSRYGSGLKQILPFMNFIFEIYKYLKKVEYDYIHCHDLDGMLTGYLTRRKRTPLIFDMHEYYEMQKSNRLVRWIIRKIVNYFHNKAYKIIYVNEHQIMHTNDNIRTKLAYIPNYPDASNFKNPRKTPSDKLRISYIGVVGQYEQLKNLMDACRNMKDVIISIHGNGIAYEKLKSIEGDYENVNITGRYRFDESLKLYNETDVHYIIYSMKNIQNKLSEPVKFYESIITKTPIICNKDTRIGDFTETNKIGFTINGDSKKEIRKLIDHLVNSRKALDVCKIHLEDIHDEYIWERVVKVLDEIYH